MNILTKTIKWRCNKSAFINMNNCYDPITSPRTIIIQLLFYSALQMFRNKKDYGFAIELLVYLSVLWITRHVSRSWALFGFGCFRRTYRKRKMIENG